MSKLGSYTNIAKHISPSCRNGQPDPKQVTSRAKALAKHRSADRLAAGDLAPDLDLSRLDEQGSVELAAKRNRPLVLFFGSYT